jgi:glycine/D-amino acid oxidase-like deaminating enzyme
VTSPSARSLTRHRDLRSGISYWQSRRMAGVTHARLTRDTSTEILVVGAGISGALVAEAMSRDCKVLIVDRRGIAKGSTAASTALVEYEIDTPLILLGKKIGASKAGRAWRRSHLALTALGERTAALGIDADIATRETLYLAGNVLDPAGLKREAAARLRIGLETAYLTAGELKRRFAISRHAALLSYGDFSADPRRLTAGYLNAAIANGARVFAPVEIVDVDKHRAGVAAHTRDGRTIAARHVIFATGYEVPKIVPPGDHRIISTYAIATRPQRRNLWPGEAMIWEASDPYLYLRTTPDGRVICGGEDEDFADEAARDALIAPKTATIARKLGRLLPQIDTTPEFAWAGSFGTTATGLPLIGRVPRHPNVWAILGFGGNGITYSRIAADIVASGIAGRKNPDADLYAFG